MLSNVKTGQIWPKRYIGIKIMLLSKMKTGQFFFLKGYIDFILFSVKQTFSVLLYTSEEFSLSYFKISVDGVTLQTLPTSQHAKAMARRAKLAFVLVKDKNVIFFWQHYLLCQVFRLLLNKLLRKQPCKF